jgi:hypothetical protein
LSVAGLWAWCRANDAAPPPLPPGPPPDDPIQLGAAAQRLLQDPTFALALGRVQERLTDAWRNSAVGGTDAREAAYRLHCAVEQLRTELHLMVANGKAAGRQDDGRKL